MNLEHKIFEDLEFEGAWRVESRDQKSGAEFIALFSGPAAERMANEYLVFKTGKHPALKAEAPTASTPVTQDTFLIHTEQAGDINIRPKDMIWKYDARRQTVSGKPRPAIERLGITKKGKE